ncbi:MAG: SPOR domain-containing protein [Bacteroidia bacterium]
MVKRIALIALVFLSCALKAQQDSLLFPSDSLSPEELLQWYINEPEPFSNYKGDVTVGDSLYTTLNNSVVPTQTVHAKGLFRYGEEDEGTEYFDQDSTNNYAQAYKPKIALGVGRFGFYGDIYSKHFQIPQTARIAYDLSVSQRLSRYLQLNFNAIFGKLGGNEIVPGRNANFLSEIRVGGLNLLYDFGNFIPDKYTLRPFVSLGIVGFEYLSKTDLMDANGNAYHYWSDGSIKNMAEGSANAQYAVDLKRDYVFETDVRESNVYLFGRYPERSWALPVGAGFIMKVTDRVDVKFNFQFFLSATDYIDGITDLNGGKKNKDHFTYTSFSIQYDLISKPLKRKKKEKVENVDWLALDIGDADSDGVKDWDDDCHGTPADVKVTADGCPEDTDQDGIPNYRDDELDTPAGMVVDEKGVTVSDDFWAQWGKDYNNDTLDENIEIEYIGNIYANSIAKNQLMLKNKKQDIYTVELARYSGSIPSDEMAFLLSIGDINSTTLDDGTTVVYTSGNFTQIKNAVKSRDEFVKMGNTNASVAKKKGNNIEKLSESELQKLLKEENDLLASGDNDSNLKTKIDSLNNAATENFGQDEIVYRVQLGAFKNKISMNVFNTSVGVLELKAGESVYRYVTKGFKTIEEAASVRADLVIQGYSDAFVTAYKDGKRIPMNQTSATVAKGYKEDMDETKIFSSIDKSLVKFKIQLGPNKRPSQVASAEARFKDVKGLEKQVTTTGNVRFTTGSYSGYDAAEKYRKELEAKGFRDAFIIATFKDDLISIQEALELLK